MNLAPLPEPLTLGHRNHDAGAWRVHVDTTTETRHLHEEAGRVHAEIERVPIGLEVAFAPSVREEENGAVLVVPVLEEVVVIQRRIVLKEEIRIRRVVTTETVEANVALHSQSARVERHAPGTGGPDARQIGEGS